MVYIYIYIYISRARVLVETKRRKIPVNSHCSLYYTNYR